MPAPSTLPVWATDQQALIVTPPLAKQQQGWTTDTNTPQGQGEKPPLQYFNWYQNLVYQWIQFLSQAVGNLPTFGTMAEQNANDVTISGGNIDNTPIGLNTPDAAAFTKAVDSGDAPTLANQLANKAYVDSKLKTGMVMPYWGLASSVPQGFIAWVDGTIGSAASSATIRANADTQALYTLLWNSASDANCPVTGGRGSSAAADFEANKPIQVPRANGMAVGIAGAASTVGGVTTSARNLADKLGEETHTLTISEMPSHNHTYEEATSSAPQTGDTTECFTGNSTQTTGSTGGNEAHNNIQPTTFVTYIVAL